MDTLSPGLLILLPVSPLRSNHIVRIWHPHVISIVPCQCHVLMCFLPLSQWSLQGSPSKWLLISGSIMAGGLFTKVGLESVQRLTRLLFGFNGIIESGWFSCPALRSQTCQRVELCFKQEERGEVVTFCWSACQNRVRGKCCVTLP